MQWGRGQCADHRARNHCRDGDDTRHDDEHIDVAGSDDHRGRDHDPSADDEFDDARFDDEHNHDHSCAGDDH
jgi:hypothetical protein